MLLYLFELISYFGIKGDPSCALLKLVLFYFISFKVIYFRLMLVHRTKVKFKAQCPPLRIHINGDFIGERRCLTRKAFKGTTTALQKCA